MSKINWSDEQLLAIEKMIDFLTSSEKVFVLTGFAGTGKTAVLNEYVQYLDSTRGRRFFRLCAPTHKARFVLESATNYESITLHKLLSMSPNLNIFNLDYKDLKFESKGVGDFPTNGLIIIDEASMVSDHLYDLLIEYCNFNNCKVIFVGDAGQLMPVKNGGNSKVFLHPNNVSLTKIFRQDSNTALAPILLTLRTSPILKFESQIGESGSLLCYTNTQEFIERGLDKVKIAIKEHDVNKTKFLAYTNNRVQALNGCIRRLLFDDNELYHKNEILTGLETFDYNGNEFYNSADYIITNVSRTNRNIPYFMRLPGFSLTLYDSIDKTLMPVFIIDHESISPDILDSLGQYIETVRLDAIQAKKYGNKTKAGFLWKKYYDIMKSFATPKDLMFDNRVIKPKTFDYGYASTVHKSQGSSYNEVFVDMNNLKLNKDYLELRQLQYVALSRTQTNAHILI